MRLDSGFTDPNGARPFDYPINPNTGNSKYMKAPQLKPTIQQCDPTGLQAISSGGMLVGLMDGSVRTVATGISTNTLARAFVPNDGFVLGSDW